MHRYKLIRVISLIYYLSNVKSYNMLYISSGNIIVCLLYLFVIWRMTVTSEEVVTWKMEIGKHSKCQMRPLV